MPDPPVTLLPVYEIALGVASLLFDVPSLVVVVAGLALLVSQGRRLPGRSHRLAVAGLAVLLANTVLSLLNIIALPHLLDVGVDTVDRVRLFSAAATLVLGATYSVGIALLVLALLKAREPAPVASVPAESV
jgi:hypothetical protein